MQSLQRRVGVVGMVLWVGCGGGSSATPDASHPDAAMGIDARAGDAMLDGGGGGNACQAITPWCADGFCLTIPAAPQIGLPPAPQPWNASATALGANGELFVSVVENNTLASITPSSAMSMVVLPAGTQPGFKLGSVTAMTAVSPTDIYACAELSIVWHYDGTAWSQLPTDWTVGQCDVLWSRSATDFWKIGAGRLIRKLNGVWTDMPVAGPVAAIDGRSASDVWFGGSHGSLGHWDGTHYQVLIDSSSNSSVPDVRNVAELGPTDIAFGTNRLINGTVMTSAQLGYPAAPDVTWGSSNDFWIVTKTDGVTPQALWHYTGTWAQQAVPSVVTLAKVGITGRGPNDVWFVADHALLHWDGTTLATCATWGGVQPTGHLVGVGTAYNDLWLQDSANSLWHSTGGGDFVAMTLGAAGMRGFDASAAGVFAVAGTDNGNPNNGVMPIVQRYAGGTTWTSITCPWTQGEDALLLAAKVVAANDVWFAGDTGHVFHWDGTTCTTVAHPLASTTINHINARSATDVWFFGDTATLHWDGTQLVRFGQTIPVVDSVATSTSLIGIATNDVLEWNGTTWTSRGGGSIANARAIWATSGSDVWVYGNTGLVRFDGTTWTPLAIPNTAIVGSGVGVGLWGTGTAGDFALSFEGGIVRHQ